MLLFLLRLVGLRMLLLDLLRGRPGCLVQRSRGPGECGIALDSKGLHAEVLLLGRTNRDVTQAEHTLHRPRARQKAGRQDGQRVWGCVARALGLTREDAVEERA